MTELANTDCSIYRCSRQDEMYLYVRADLAPDDLPQSLIKLVGRLEFSMNLSLNPQRKLARVDVAEVLRCLAEHGFFLQMPPEPLKPRATDGSNKLG